MMPEGNDVCVRSKAAFTLVELIAAMASAAVLAVVMGAMMWYSYSGWRSMQAIGEMERDGSLAMRTMDAVIRGGTSTNPAAVMNRFAKSGGRLVYTPGSGGTMDLVQAGVTGFSCVTSANNKVSVGLRLLEPGANVTMSFSNTITLRN